MYKNVPNHQPVNFDHACLGLRRPFLNHWFADRSNGALLALQLLQQPG